MKNNDIDNIVNTKFKIVQAMLFYYINFILHDLMVVRFYLNYKPSIII